MLTSVTITNLRSIGSVSIRLEPLTVLVGPNASGKSSVLRAFDPQALRAEDVRGHDPSADVGFEFALEPGRGSGKVSWGGGRPNNWKERPYVFGKVHLDLASLRAGTQLQPERAVDSQGAGLTNLFFSLSRAQKGELARKFCSLVPVFQDVDTQVTAPGTIEFRFQDRWDPSLWYRPHEVSDGSMPVLAYLMIPYQEPSPTLLTIEEPERGLHAYLLGELVRVLRELTTADKPIQIVMATHSAELLEFVKPEEVRFLSKNSSDGSVSVEEVEPGNPNWKEAYAAHLESLGSVWLSGGLGGVPAL